MLGNPTLASGVATSILVTAVMMATLVVGPFYLAGALGLDAAGTGLAMACGPVTAALAGVPAGRIVDSAGVQRSSVVGLAVMLAGCAMLALLAGRAGIAGYVLPLAVLTAGYALFQASNNTAIMSSAAANDRGVVSGLASLARNLGLIAGASAMASVYAVGASPVEGMQLTFLAALVVLAVALVIALAVRGSEATAGTCT
jgi:MFS family permease